MADDTRTDEEAIEADALRLAVAQHLQSLITQIEGDESMASVVTLLNQTGAVICASKEVEVCQMLNPLMPDIEVFIQNFYSAQGGVN
jgi:hypothetical protein